MYSEKTAYRKGGKRKTKDKQYKHFKRRAKKNWLVCLWGCRLRTGRRKHIGKVSEGKCCSALAEVGGENRATSTIRIHKQSGKKLEGTTKMARSGASVEGSGLPLVSAVEVKRWVW